MLPGRLPIRHTRPTKAAERRRKEEQKKVKEDRDKISRIFRPPFGPLSLFLSLSLASCDSCFVVPNDALIVPSSFSNIHSLWLLFLSSSSVCEGEEKGFFGIEVLVCQLNLPDTQQASLVRHPQSILSLGLLSLLFCLVFSIQNTRVFTSPHCP